MRHFDTGDRLSELQRFDGEDAGEALADRVYRAMLEGGRSPNDAGSFFKGIAEVVNNVVEHSGRHGGWAAMQVMPNRSGMVTFAVADAGSGLERTIRRHHDVVGPIEAMQKAFEHDVSGTGAIGRGQGLADLVRRVGRHRGNIRAWSGSARGLSRGEPIACTAASATFPGTVIYAEFRPDQEVWP